MFKIIDEFIILAEELNFSKAAEKLYMNQSTLSKHIQKLEDTLDFQLFKRGNSIVLTADGKIYYKEIKKIKSKYNRIVSNLRKNETGELLKIGTLNYYKKTFLKLNDQFNQEHNDIKISYIVGQPNEVVKKTLNGEIDIASIVNVTDWSRLGLHFYPCNTENLVLLVNENHYLSKYSTIKFSDLKSVPLTYPNNEYFKEFIKYLYRHCCEYANFDLTKNKICFSEDIENMFFKVQLGDYVTILPDNMLGYPFTNCKYIPIEEDITIMRGLVYKEEHPNIDLINKFIKSINLYSIKL